MHIKIHSKCWYLNYSYLNMQYIRPRVIGKVIIEQFASFTSLSDECTTLLYKDTKYIPFKQ